MPDQSSASTEHALIQEIAAPLAGLPDDPVPEVADVDFQIVLRGYDRLAVDAYVRRVSKLVADLNASRSPQAAVRRALERVGGEVAGILQRAHETADEITTASRREAEDRLEAARQEAEAIMADAREQAQTTVGGAQHLLTELDAETDRIWNERHQIVEDARGLAAQLIQLAEAAVERFPAADERARAYRLPGEQTDEHDLDGTDEHDLGGPGEHDLGGPGEHDLGGPGEHDLGGTDEHDLGGPGGHDLDGTDEQAGGHLVHTAEHDLEEHELPPAEEETGELPGSAGQHTEPFDIEAEAPLPGEEPTTQHTLPFRRVDPPAGPNDDDPLSPDAE